MNGRRVLFLLVVAAGAIGCTTILNIDGSDDPPPTPPGTDGGVPTESGGADAPAPSDAAAADTTVPEASCGDTSSDKDNCGACGRRCNAGGSCTGGRCDRFVVFVTSTTQKGNFGGTAADTVCTKLATNAKLGGTFQVWIAGAVTRFAPVPRPYYRTDGMKVADSWPPAGDLQNPIHSDELGRTVDTFVWSNLEPDATLSTVNNCLGWANPAANQQGGYGRSVVTTAEWTHATLPSDRPCNEELSLYCVERP